jgi:hypothetical protein
VTRRQGVPLDVIRARVCELRGRGAAKARARVGLLDGDRHRVRRVRDAREPGGDDERLHPAHNLTAGGWRTLRFTWYQVNFCPEWVLGRVLDTLRWAA